VADIVADDAIVSKAVRVKFVSSPRTVGPSWAVTGSTIDIPTRTVCIITVSKKALSALKGPGRACFRLALVILAGINGRPAPGGTASIAMDASRESAETDVLVDDVQGRPPTLRRTCHLQFSLNMSNGLGPGEKRSFLRLEGTRRSFVARLDDARPSPVLKANVDGGKDWCRPVPFRQRRSFLVLFLPTNLPPLAVSDHEKCGRRDDARCCQDFWRSKWPHRHNKTHCPTRVIP
jgi:hypothetical protein